MTRRAITASLISALSPFEMRAAPERWVIYYSNAEPVHAFNKYSLLIFDSRYYPPLPLLSAQGKILVGYLSLGEASRDYTYFGELESEGLLVRPSLTWKGNYYIDIRDSRWPARLVDTIVPRILANGFQGLFLDTLDSSLHLEQLDPSRYRGMAAAAAELIREIRRLRPGITLILNRAYSLLPEVDRDIDVAMGESVYTTYDFERKIYSKVPLSAYRQQVEWLRAAARRRSGLRIFTLDYWDPSDKEQIAHIYREERANGFSPYVTSIDLTHIVPEPGLSSDVARKVQKTSQKRTERPLSNPKMRFPGR